MNAPETRRMARVTLSDDGLTRLLQLPPGHRVVAVYTDQGTHGVAFVIEGERLAPVPFGRRLPEIKAWANADSLAIHWPDLAGPPA